MGSGTALAVWAAVGSALVGVAWGISQYISYSSDHVQVNKDDDPDPDPDPDRYGRNAKKITTGFVFESAPDRGQNIEIGQDKDDDDDPDRYSRNAKKITTGFVFKSAPNRGKKIEIGQGDGAVTNSRLKTLKIMSYNICSREEYPIRKRMKVIGGLVQLHSPDFICFQEITLQIYTIFQRQNWWENYHCSISEEEASEQMHFCVLLSKYTLTKITNRPLGNSKIKRLSAATIKFGEKNSLAVASGHLKSACPDPNDPKSQDHKFTRERTLRANDALSILNKHPNVIFCGDMNWNEKTDGEFPLPSGWIDSWNELKGKKKGYTFDTYSNKMLASHSPLRERLDRICCNFKDKGFRVANIEIIGKSAIPGVTYKPKKRSLPVLPSDHYGLLLTVSI